MRQEVVLWPLRQATVWYRLTLRLGSSRQAFSQMCLWSMELFCSLQFPTWKMPPTVTRRLLQTQMICSLTETFFYTLQRLKLSIKLWLHQCRSTLIPHYEGSCCPLCKFSVHEGFVSLDLPWNDVRWIVDSCWKVVGENPVLEPRSVHLEKQEGETCNRRRSIVQLLQVI